VLPMLSAGLEIEPSDVEAENATLQDDYLRQVVEMVIGGSPTVLEVRFMCLFMSLDRILLQGAVLTNLFDPMKSTSPAVAYGCRGCNSFLLKDEQLYRNMPSKSPDHDTTPVVRNVRSVANRQNQRKRGPSGNAQFLLAMRCVSVPAGERGSSQGGSSVPSTMHSQNSTPASLLNNSGIADITQCVTCTLSATQ
jgi:hypothetical protein